MLIDFLSFVDWACLHENLTCKPNDGQICYEK